MPPLSIQEFAKEKAAKRALDFLEPGMTVGLGSGSTSAIFIEELGKRVQQGFDVRGVASSVPSEARARKLGIPLCDFNTCMEIDLAVDGADEIAPGLALIKGGGGFLLREKIVVSAAKRFIVVADTTKLVPQLGGAPLPVEVIQLAAPLVRRRLDKLMLKPVVRRVHETGQDYITDEGNLLLDCSTGGIPDPEQLQQELRGIVGVVEHGLFLKMADLAIVSDGKQTYEYTRESTWTSNRA